MEQPVTTKRITTEPAPHRVRVTLGGVVVADSTRALVLREGTYRPVLYIPREDADMALFTRTEHSTHCPWKGDASYFSLAAGGKAAVNAVWSYETPLAAVGEIAGMLAFYPDRVDGIEEIAE